nr:molybdenum hydroxylase [Candidatus Wallbacteria bacterium]
ARIDGVIRGLLPDNFKVKFYTKIGDIDPRNDNAFCFSISDKSRSIGRAALEAVLIKIKEGVIKP